MSGARPLSSGEETTAEREARLAREAELIAEAREDVAAGRVVPLEAIEAWVESWDTEAELPPPSSQR